MVWIQRSFFIYYGILSVERSKWNLILFISCFNRVSDIFEAKKIHTLWIHLHAIPEGEIVLFKCGVFPKIGLWAWDVSQPVKKNYQYLGEFYQKSIHTMFKPVNSRGISVNDTVFSQITFQTKFSSQQWYNRIQTVFIWPKKSTAWTMFPWLSNQIPLLVCGSAQEGCIRFITFTRFLLHV